MDTPFRFETKINLYTLDYAEAEVTVNLWCGDVLLDQRVSKFVDDDEGIKAQEKAAKESMSTTLGNALNDLMRKGGYTS